LRGLLKLEPGTELLERYVVHSSVGAGGMGEVYRCFDKARQQEVVAKFPLRDQLEEEKGRELFTREFTLLSEIRHKNIVEVYEFHELEDGLPFFTMEYLKGSTLRDYLDQHPGAVTKRESTLERLKILEGVAEALCHTHSLGVLHHDLKPENIYLLFSCDQDDSEIKLAKLLDFGLVLDQENHTPEEAREGSLFYKSPEQYRTKKIDVTSEIYAFGSLAYEMFSGNRPFDLKERRMVIEFVLEGIIGRKHCVGDVPYMKNIYPRTRVLINRFIQICMEKEGDFRYQSMHQVLSRLSDIRQHLESPSWGERILRIWKREDYAKG